MGYISNNRFQLFGLKAVQTGGSRITRTMKAQFLVFALTRQVKIDSVSTSMYKNFVLLRQSHKYQGFDHSFIGLEEIYHSPGVLVSWLAHGGCIVDSHIFQKGPLS